MSTLINLILSVLYNFKRKNFILNIDHIGYLKNHFLHVYNLNNNILY